MSSPFSNSQIQMINQSHWKKTPIYTMQFHIRKSTYVKCPWTVLTQFTLGSVIQQNSHSSLDQKQMYIKKIIDWQIEGSGLDVACVEIILKFRCNITQAQWNVPQKKMIESKMSQKANESNWDESKMKCITGR